MAKRKYLSTAGKAMAAQRSRNKKARRPRRSFAGRKKFIKSVALSLAETKMKVIPFSNLNLTTSTFSAFDLNSMDQGDLGSTRDGSQIICRGFHIKGYMFNRSFLEPVMVRMLIIKGKRGVETNVTGSQAMFTDGIEKKSYNDITAQALYYPVDKTRFSVLYDKIYKLGVTSDPNTLTTTTMYSGVDARSSGQLLNIWINGRDQRLNFTQSDNDTTPDVRYHLVIIPVQYDRTQTVAVGGSNVTFNMLGRFYYKDP